MLPMTNEISRITKKDMVLGGYHIPAGVSNFDFFPSGSSLSTEIIIY
jgi:hypothetical protein